MKSMRSNMHTHVSKIVRRYADEHTEAQWSGNGLN